MCEIIQPRSRFEMKVLRYKERKNSKQSLVGLYIIDSTFAHCYIQMSLYVELLMGCLFLIGY